VGDNDVGERHRDRSFSRGANVPDADIQVLIVGAGPVGLFLANECARRGLSYRIIEARSGQSLHSKALAVFPRTMEIFDMAGVVGPFLQHANPVTTVCIAPRQRALARIPFKPADSPYPFVAMVPQDVTEKVLVAELRRKGGDVDYDTACVAVDEQSDGRVSVTLEQKGKRSTTTAAFVVGCDGAHSTIRHALHLPFEGAPYEASFMLADVMTNEWSADAMHLCPHPSGALAIFPMSARRCRVVATIDRPDGDAPSLDLVRRLVGERAPAGIEARSLVWSSYFRIHHRLVAQLRSGRIFIAGDAAHIHSPFGGQGMNTGLHHAWNLAWKLDLAARGLAGEELLASYTAERLPVIRGVIDTTHMLTRVMDARSWIVQTVRNMAIPLVSRLPAFRRAFVRNLSGLGIAYGGSPIVEGAGARYFDDSLCGGAGIKSRFLLVLDSEAPKPELEAAGGVAQAFSDVLELRQGRRRGLTLIRPDGYVAYAADNNVVAPLQSARALLERQTVRIAERAS
jgi:2-polyprenyl-6-methoxyphenol hydroxylase-like FAD-dependent oxidoreductase